jgi:hypothetical protein
MSLQALVTFAVEVAEATGSQTPFYVAGGLLALWAVVVSFVGLRRHAAFPGSSGGRAGVMAVTTVLVVAAMASAVLSS